MDKWKTAIMLIGVGIVIGAIVVVLLFYFGARPNKVTVGVIEFELPTVIPTPTIQQIPISAAVATDVPLPTAIITVAPTQSAVLATNTPQPTQPSPTLRPSMTPTIVAATNTPSSTMQPAITPPATVTPYLTLTRVVPTIQPIPGPTPGFPVIFLDQGGVPNGTTMSIKVDAGTIHVMASGRICVEGTCLPRGEQRGSIVVLLPRDRPYALTDLNPTYNWHGAYYGSPDQWKVVAEDRAANMKRVNTDNCIDNKGCAIVDVLAIDARGIFAQYTR